MNLRRRTKNDGSFHFSISRILLLGNFVGFPIIGIYSRDISNVGFKWMSFRSIYSLFLLIMSIFFLICYFIWMLNSVGDFSIQTFHTFTLHLRNVLCLILLQRLARNWNHFILKWINVEQYLPTLRTQHEKNFIKRKITILQIVVISISLGKYIQGNRTFWNLNLFFNHNY